MSVLRYKRAELDGPMARLRSVDNIREDMERAVGLLPGDGLSRTMLGMWFYEVAQLSWLERQVVAAAGQSVPSPDESLDRALSCFQEAERLRPGHSNLNQLMLAKTLSVREGLARARPHLEGAARTPPRTHSDAKAQLEAAELLRRWEVSTPS